ncbi:hypothetical protein BUALT_Bualt01G0085600 [Buddleja alternifolia]|uniref:RING-type domain-containing protein n=1 Tax=Buddleja alternifolia TaxID=168488 RepID=A0AAV6YG13_9LAMI|nr:hypothetical protein BUALT_Bualt01G0085600 [Buddleja alternifolia]
MPLFFLSTSPCFLIRILNYISIVLSFVPIPSSASLLSKRKIDESRPEQFPPPFINESAKERVSECRKIHLRAAESCDDLCVVCLTGMERCSEVRWLPNCCHVFHKDCINAWIDKSKTTCPVCRSDISIISSKQEIDELELEQLPSPLLVHVPLNYVVESIKEHVIVSKYREILLHVAESCDSLCVVCLTIMEEYDEVRRLPNCCHVFHKDCIDGWIDKCKTTCPVCRSKMLPGQEEKFKCGVDPWRRERMLYLFGEDHLM